MGKRRYRFRARFWILLSAAVAVLAAALVLRSCTRGESGAVEPQPEEATLLAPGESGDPNYIKDMLFVGDSRTLGLSSYGRLPAEQVLAVDGMNHSDARKEKCVDLGDGKLLTMAQAAGRIQPKRILVAFGINGMAFMDADVFIKQYEGLLHDIEMEAPGSEIILQSILPVTTEFGREQPGMSNTVIRSRNQQLLALAEENRYFYLNVSEAVEGGDGSLDPAYATGDGLHLRPSAYDAILEYVRGHPAPG